MARLPLAGDLEGTRVPRVIFRTRADGGWRDVGSETLFSGRSVVLFSLAGAFTPSCSGAPLPRFIDACFKVGKAAVPA